MSRSFVSDLKRFFQRTPFLAARNMREDVQPTMDASLEWPLFPILQNLGYTAAAGSNTKILASPRSGTHVVMVYAFFTTDVPAIGDASALFIKQKNVATGISATNLSIVNLTPGRGLIPLINSVAVDDNGLFLTGVRTVYVPAGFELVHLYSGAAGGEAVTLRTQRYEFPETQPVTSLISAF